MSQHTGNLVGLMALYVFVGIGTVLFSNGSGFASGEELNTPHSPKKSSESSSAPSPQSAETDAAKKSLDKKGQEELEALRKKPDEFRTLMTGVQIFLGRFGYGVGPYTGILDQTTKQALKAYQKHSGLSQTGDLDFPTLKHLTEDDRLLNRVVPFLPPQTFQDQEWGQWVEVQGSWMLKEGNTDEVLQTSRVTCMKEFKRCIDSTAFLVNANVPQLKVHTHVYDIQEWDDANIVSAPYDGEACAVSILRISRNPPLVTRFLSLQNNPGPCAKVQAEDRQYVLEDGPKIYQILRMQKAEAIQQILQVTK
ncbi:peptidoglycan-binding domain-containing protein [Candidatus Nitrospira allomarina]|jgi:putative peptidoglycan binding protein|uniref:Peptidoglycan-binding protein n=1 Tax=Candidatus Nitrospira allomarina TaxID=3020900 RepID=A0AA96GDC9_9BACT|nr:peptidoglycan-binding protein [Candidatus Nitrospira allomarina]WNM59047.1 peptidoglycan-binding protein [Candidatus Nitrospira allomarina]